jgi:putative ABC transport system substrate-binding protein
MVLPTPRVARFMKNKILILTSLLILFFNTSSVKAGDGILSIQSIDIAPYQEALKGFQSVCTEDIQSFVISEMKDKDIIKEIRKKNPSIILSIGMDALKKIKEIEDIPVIYLMVPNPQSFSESALNLTGVRMNIKQEDQISYFRKAVPSMKTIGLLYDPERTGFLAQRAIDACKKAGVNLVAKEIKSSRDVPSEIKKMEGKVDGFWMLPDVTVFTPEGLEYLFLFSMKNKVPILTFSEVYLESGALISIGVDSFDMGAQAGEIAMEILSGRPVSDIHPADARKEVISINLKISGKLGLSIDETLFSNAKFLK